METLHQGIIRPACQARSVWHVVKRPPRLSPKNSLLPFPHPARAPSLGYRCESARQWRRSGRCENTCIPTKDNDYHDRIPPNTAQRNFYGTSRREILQKSRRLMKLYSDIKLCGIFFIPPRKENHSLSTRCKEWYKDIGKDENMETNGESTCTTMIKIFGILISRKPREKRDIEHLVSKNSNLGEC